MSTHDYVIANASGSAVRADINNVLAAIVSNNSSSSEPSTKYAYMLWADTTNGILKIRNSANNAWIELLQLDGTLTMEDGAEATPGLAFRDDLNTGIWSSAADTFNISTGGTERLELGAATVFNESGADVDFRIEGDSQPNLFYVDAGNDRIGLSTNTPDTLLHLEATNTSTSINNAIRISDKDTAVVADQVCGRIEFETADTGNPGVNCQIDAIYSGNGGGGELQIRTGFAGSLVDALRIDDTGNVTLGAGNLVVANGKGLDFSAKTPDAASGTPSEILSDYEFGAWVPTASSGCDGLTYNSTNTYYQKVGRVVDVWGQIYNPTNVTSNPIRFAGLPFTPTKSATGVAMFTSLNCPSNSVLTMYIATDDTLRIYRSGIESNASWVEIDGDEFTNNGQFYFHASYVVA